jgi:hypothetical protein
MDKDALQFRCKVKFIPSFRDIKRLDTEPVPSQYEPLFGVAPDRQSEHASQSRKTVGIPFKKCLQNGFCIAVSLKAAT